MRDELTASSLRVEDGEDAVPVLGLGGEAFDLPYLEPLEFPPVGGRVFGLLGGEQGEYHRCEQAGIGSTGRWVSVLIASEECAPCRDI